MSIKLLPCPYCENEARLWVCPNVRSTSGWHETGYRVVCAGCGMKTEWFGKSADAAQHWNKIVKEERS